jgi:NlpC/P60 family putative phage cell wall peptidase
MNDRVVTAAMSWLGTPYKHQHSTKGAGCDCLGLIRGVYREVVGDEPFPAPAYSPSWGEGVAGQDALMDAARTALDSTDISDLTPGNVLIFRMRRGMVAKHCGIVSRDGHMLHAYMGAGRVTESRLVPYWTSKIAGVFKYPE